MLAVGRLAGRSRGPAGAHGGGSGPGGQHTGWPCGRPGELGDPVRVLVTAAIVPLAAGLYLLTTTAWMLGERTVLPRRFVSLTETRP